MLKLLFATLLYAANGLAQQAIEMGGTVDTSQTPNKSVYVSYLRPIGTGFSSYTTFSFWQVAPHQIAHTVITGVEHAVFSPGPLTITGHAQVGEAQSANAFSGAFSGGGTLLLAPAKFKNISLTITGGAMDVPATGAWYPRVSVGLRYNVAGP